MVRARGDDAATPPRLHMLASVREVVLDLLADDPDDAAAHQDVSHWALGLARAALDRASAVGVVSGRTDADKPATAHGPVPGEARGAVVPADGPLTDELLSQESSLVAELARAMGDDGSRPRLEDALCLGAAMLGCWSSSWCYSQIATWIPRLTAPALAPAPDPEGNVARMLILYRAATMAWLLGALPDAVREAVPRSYPGESAWSAGVRRFVRTRQADWPALVDGADPWAAWAAGSRVVVDLENRGQVDAALVLNRAALDRMRADGMPYEQVLEAEVDGLRLVLETGDYATAVHECSRILREAERSGGHRLQLDVLRLQRECCEVYLDPTPQRAAALLERTGHVQVPGVAAFVRRCPGAPSG